MQYPIVSSFSVFLYQPLYLMAKKTLQPLQRELFFLRKRRLEAQGRYNLYHQQVAKVGQKERLLDCLQRDVLIGGSANLNSSFESSSPKFSAKLPYFVISESPATEKHKFKSKTDTPSKAFLTFVLPAAPRRTRRKTTAFLQ